MNADAINLGLQKGIRKAKIGLIGPSGVQFSFWLVVFWFAAIPQPVLEALLGSFMKLVVSGVQISLTISHSLIDRQIRFGERSSVKANKILIVVNGFRRISIEMGRVLGAVIDSDSSVNEQKIRIAVVVGLLDMSPIAANAALSQLRGSQRVVDVGSMDQKLWHSALESINASARIVADKLKHALQVQIGPLELLQTLSSVLGLN